jgi:hypothetical protein
MATDSGYRKISERIMRSVHPNPIEASPNAKFVEKGRPAGLKLGIPVLPVKNDGDGGRVRSPTRSIAQSKNGS